MTYYKSVRYIDGKRRWVIEDEYGNIDKNPTKEQLICAEIDYQKRTMYKDVKCCVCGSADTYERYSGDPDWLRCDCGKKDCLKYRCRKCYEKKRQELKLNHNAIRNSLAKIRTGNLDRYTPLGMAIIDQAVVSKVLCIEDLNIKLDNFTISTDMKDCKLGIIDVKSSSLRYDHSKGIEYWDFHTFRKIDCDTYICLGYDMMRYNIVVVWIIPNDDDNSSLDRFKITKNLYGLSKYDKFKIDQKCYNDAYRDLILYLEDKTFFGVEDIKRWMKTGIIR